MVITKVKVRSRLVIRVPITKPRHKALNDALVSLGGGPQRNVKHYNRNREKQITRERIEEIE